MKLVRRSRGRLTFRLAGREKELLFRVLGLYPLVPPAHHQLSKERDGSAPSEDQRLLDESLAEQRDENRRQVLGLLKKPRRFRKAGRRIEFSLKTTEVESLLQVLNDVRVGAWIALGEPEELHEPVFDENNAPFFLAMDLAGYFQANLLAAIEGA